MAALVVVNSPDELGECEVPAVGVEVDMEVDMDVDIKTDVEMDVEVEGAGKPIPTLGRNNAALMIVTEYRVRSEL